MLVTIDFETYYDKDYTLKKLSTSEYIRDKRFEALSCSIKLGHLTPYCYFGKDEIASALAGIKWEETVFLAHNAHFDGLILSHHFGHVPKRYADTLSMARALHPKAERNRLEDVAVKYNKVNKLPMPDFKGKHLADLTKEDKKAIILYNNGDVESCREVYDEMLIGFPATELDLIDITVRMFADPALCVDLDLAQDELEAERTRKSAAIANSGVDEKVLSSNVKFPTALKALGVDVPMKPSPSVANKEIPAIAKGDEALQALLLHPDPKIAALVAGRLAVKSTMGESRAVRMLLRGEGGMRLPIYLAAYGAHTHRWTGGDKFNPQNFKHMHKVGGNLKKAIIAPPGYMIVKVDSAQIEARIVAWLFDEDWVLDAFRAGRDIYCEFGSDVYERPITKADTEERFVSKTCVLGLGFGMGGPKLQVSILTKSIEQGMNPVRIPIEVCFLLVTKYRQKCRNIEAGWKFMNDQGIGAMLSGKEMQYKCLTFKKGKIELPNGLALLYPGISANVVRKGGRGFFKGETAEAIHDASYFGAKTRNKLYGGLLVENEVQALARIAVADVMRQITERYRVVAMEHDAIVFLAPVAEAQTALDWAIKLMSVSPHWAPDLPLTAEGGFDVCYPK